MWFLVEADPAPNDCPAPRYWLGGPDSGGRLIGRKNVHIRIKQPSVSRSHATLRVEQATSYSLSEVDAAEHVRSTTVFIEDSSAYGSFYRYPEDHLSSQGTPHKGHHKRLAKNAPTELAENALLAFGAPNFWWRLGWNDVLVFIPKYISSTLTNSVRKSAKDAGMEVAGAFSDTVTHVVVHEVKSDCMPIFHALARGAHVVSPAWVSSVQHTVMEACQVITDAQSNDAALAGSKLADEVHFVPKYSKEMKKKFPAKVLENVFSVAVASKRSMIFKNRVFAFADEDACEKWKPILSQLGAKILIAGPLQKESRNGIIVVEEQSQGSKKRKSNTNQSAITEHAIMAAILSGDESYIVPEVVEPAVDEATDIDEEVVVTNVRAQKIRSNKTSEDSETTVKTTPDSLRPAKKARTKANVVAQNEEKSSRADEGDTGDKIREDDNEAMNPRSIVPMKNTINEDTFNRNETKKSSGNDVRRFKRRNMPRSSKIPLKRARQIDLEEEYGATPRRRDRSGSRSRGSSSMDMGDE